MSGSYLFDTSIIVSIFRGDIDIADTINKSEILYLPVIALAELYYGAVKSGHIKRNMNQIQLLANKCPLLPCDAGTALEYADIKNKLRLKGKPIPDNDIWIAAIAKQHKLIVITRDTHFSEIDDIKSEIC